MSVPYLDNGYYYLTRYEEGKEHPIYARKKTNPAGDEKIILDVNDLAKGYDYYHVAGRSVSPDNSILAYGEDTLSRRIYTLRFKDLRTGQMLEDKITNTTGNCVWANDNKTVFYTRKDVTLRAFKILRHTLGTDPANDVEIYHEKDDTYSVGVRKTKSKKYIVIGSYATLANEYRLLAADDPYGTFQLFIPRKHKHEHFIDHVEDRFYIRTNWDAPNFRLMSCTENHTEQDHWQEEIGHRPEVLLEDMDFLNPIGS